MGPTRPVIPARRPAAWRRGLYMGLCLVGTLPALLTNTLPTTALFPGVESFRWAAFELEAARVLFAVLLAAAAVLALQLRLRWGWLALLPLLLLVLTPANRIGAPLPPDPERWATPLGGTQPLTAEDAEIAALAEPIGRIDRALAHLPPRLPDATELQTLRALLANAAEREAQRDARVAQRAQVAKQSALAALGFFARLSLNEYQATLNRLDRDIARLEAPPGADRRALHFELRLAIQRHATWRIEKRAAWLQAPYAIASALLWLAWLWRRGLANRVTAGCALVALPLAFWAAATAWPGGGGRMVLAALQPLVVGGAVLVLLRVLCRAWQDNRQLRRAFSTAQLKSAGAWALLLWLPFAAVLAASLWVGQLAQQWVAQRIYCQGLDLAACVNPGDALVRDSDPARDTLREDLHDAMARQLDRYEARALALAPPRAGIAQARAALIGQFDETLKPQIYDYPGGPERSRCGLFQPLGCLRNVPLDMMDAAYQEQRAGWRQAYVARLDAVAQAARDASQRGGQALHGAVQDQAAAAARLWRQQVDSVLVALAAASALGFVLALLLALRALLLILARLLFAQNRDLFMTLTHREAPLAAAQARVQVPEGDRLRLALQSEVLLVARRFEVDGAAPDTRWLPPQPAAWPWRRLWSRCWWVKEIDAAEQPRTVDLRSVHGAFILAWEIPAGSTVAFQWEAFVGASETVRFGKVFSLKLGTVAAGHVLVPIAHGPGRLLLRAWGRADTSQQAFSPARLLGWECGTGFRVEAASKKKSVYVDYCQVMQDERGLAVHDAPREGAGGSGLWRQLMGLLRL